MTILFTIQKMYTFILLSVPKMDVAQSPNATKNVFYDNDG
jgi:hypothetical protein